jgi:hypothetical protein
MLVHDSPPPQGERRPIEPNWRLWWWVAVAAVLAFAAVNTEGLTSAVLICSAFFVVCRAATQAIPYSDGLREWRQ